MPFRAKLRALASQFISSLYALLASIRPIALSLHRWSKPFLIGLADRTRSWPAYSISARSAIACVRRFPDLRNQATDRPAATPGFVIVVYAMLFLLGGPALCVLLPAYQGPDEHTHFFRVYQIEQGRMLSQTIGAIRGGYVDPAYMKMIEVSSVDRIATRPNEKIGVHDIGPIWGLKTSKDPGVFVGFPNTAMYSALGYLPQAAGLFVARVMTDTAAVHIIGSRVGNMIAFVALIATAIVIYPAACPAFLWLSALPMAISLATTASQDSVINALSAVLAALLLSFLDQPCTIEPATAEQERRNQAFVVAISLITLVLILAKPTHLPFIVLIPLVPYLMKHDKLLKLSSILSGLILVLAAIQLRDNSLAGLAEANGAHSAAQIAYILKNPIASMAVPIRTLWFLGQSLLLQFVGVLGWLDGYLPNPMYWALSCTTIFALGLLCFSLSGNSVRNGVLNRMENALICVGVAIIVLFAVGFLSAFSMYLVFTPPGAGVIQGLQGRYFIPPVIVTAPLLVRAMLSLYNVRFAVNRMEQRHSVSSRGSLFLLLAIAVSIWMTGQLYLLRYYVPSA